LRLSGATPELPADVAALSDKWRERFLKDPYQSKPVGFYAEDEALERVFQQNRFCQQGLFRSFREEVPMKIALGVARALSDNPDLTAHYDAILALQSRTTNPPGDGFLGLKGVTEETLKRPGTYHVALFPPSGSKENALYQELYRGYSVLPKKNIMGVLIKKIRDGEVDLEPDANSGWYDYQVHALETLLLPERGPEGEKLLLSKTYKERLVEAFRTILTKQRELHIGHLYTMQTESAAYMQETHIAPDITVEPLATYYLRSARALRFLENAVQAILGEADFATLTLANGDSLAERLPEEAAFLYGVYAQVCEDMGMAPQLLPEELTPAQLEDARIAAETWLEKCGTDRVFASDVRNIVPALSDPGATRVRYWMTLGVRLVKVKAEYARPPRFRVDGEMLGDDGYPESHGIHLGPKEFYLPVEEFAEATGPGEPYTREEFRALCDRAGSREAIIQAVGRGHIGRRLQVIAMACIGLVVAGVAVLVIRRSGRHSGTAPPD
jgi:hypothetical protein